MSWHRPVATTAALAILTLAGTAQPGEATRSRPGGAARPSSSARSSGTAPLGGVNIAALGSPARTDRTIAFARQLGAKLVRTNIPWRALQPRSPGEVAPAPLASLDRLMTDAAHAGIKVIATVDGTPCWASSAPAAQLRRCSPFRAGPANAWPPTSAAAYAGFVAYLAKRYAGQLAAIEIWNEPDQANELYFAGRNKAQRYAAILRAAYTAIKQVAPQVPVLGGSLVGSNGIFLGALYAAGIKGYYDGLAVHYYTLTLAALRRIHEVQLANGDDKPLWLDEFGWSSCWPRHRIQQEQACVTQQVQAMNITNLYRSLARTPYVAADVIYELQGSSAEDFGVLSGSGSRKPAFSALAHALASPFGNVSRVTLSLRRQGNHVVASGSGPVGDVMQLEAFQSSVLRYRALFTLDRFNRYALALPAALGTRGLSVRVFQYWTGSAGAAQKSI